MLPACLQQLPAGTTHACVHPLHMTSMCCWAWDRGTSYAPCPARPCLFTLRTTSPPPPPRRNAAPRTPSSTTRPWALSAGGPQRAAPSAAMLLQRTSVAAARQAAGAETLWRTLPLKRTRRRAATGRAAPSALAKALPAATASGPAAASSERRQPVAAMPAGGAEGPWGRLREGCLFCLNEQQQGRVPHADRLALRSCQPQQVAAPRTSIPVIMTHHACATHIQA